MGMIFEERERGERVEKWRVRFTFLHLGSIALALEMKRITGHNNCNEEASIDSLFLVLVTASRFLS